MAARWTGSLAVVALLAAAACARAQDSGILRPLTLKDCVEIALERNLPLDIARSERDIAVYGVGAAWGDWLPTLAVRAARRSARDDLDRDLPLGTFVEETSTSLEAAMLQRLPLGGAVSVGASFDKLGEDAKGEMGAHLTVVQPLLRGVGWARATAVQRDAALTRDAEEATLRSEQLDVVFRVTEAYYEVLRRRALIEVRERAIERDQQLLDFSQAKVEAKLATRRDVLSAEIILAQDRADLVNAQTEHRAALDALADVLGVRVRQTLEVVDVDVAPARVAFDEEAWVERALRDNPEVQRARWDLERDALALRVAGNERLPRLDLGLRYDDVRDGILESDFGSGRRSLRAWEASITLSYPILNRERGNAHRQERLRWEQSLRQLEETERQVVLGVRESVRNLRRSEERIDVLQKTIVGSRDKVEFANVNFQLGRASNLDITDAQKDLTEAESDLVDEIMNHRVELARLEKLLGGALP